MTLPLKTRNFETKRDRDRVQSSQSQPSPSPPQKKKKKRKKRKEKPFHSMSHFFFSIETTCTRSRYVRLHLMSHKFPPTHTHTHTTKFPCRFFSLLKYYFFASTISGYVCMKVVCLISILAPPNSQCMDTIQLFQDRAFHHHKVETTNIPLAWPASMNPYFHITQIKFTCEAMQ